MDETADLSKLTDEELDARIAGEEPASPEPAEEAPEKEETAVEEETQEEEAPEAETVEEQPEEGGAQEEVKEEDPEEKPPSRREQLRIQKLLEKYGDPRQQASQAPLQQKQEDTLDYKSEFNIEDPEVLQQLENDRNRAQSSAYNEGLQRAQSIEWKTNMRLDLPLVADKLQNMDSRDVDALNQEYLYVTGYDPATDTVRNPNVGYAEFIEAQVERAERLAKSMTANTAKNIAKQAATTGLRPDGSSAKRMNLNKPAHQMSDEELDAKINSVIPSK